MAVAVFGFQVVAGEDLHAEDDDWGSLVGIGGGGVSASPATQDAGVMARGTTRPEDCV